MATTNKPLLPFSVDYQDVGTSEKHSNAFSTSAGALKFALEQAKNASTHITFKKWTQEGGWIVDTENGDKMIDRLQGKGNPQAVSALSQLQELTAVLTKQAGKVSHPDDATVRSWLDHMFFAAKSLGVTPGAIDQARLNVFKEPVKA